MEEAEITAFMPRHTKDNILSESKVMETITVNLTLTIDEISKDIGLDCVSRCSLGKYMKE